IPTIELEVNDSCLYVDVYRTRERDDDGGENENEFYYIGRYQKGLVHRTTATYEVSPYPSDPPNLTELSEDVDFLYFDSRGDTFTDLVGWKVVFDTSQGHTVEVGTE